MAHKMLLLYCMPDGAACTPDLRPTSTPLHAGRGMQAAVVAGDWVKLPASLHDLLTITNQIDIVSRALDA
jgi:hypothetical protein